MSIMIKTNGGGFKGDLGNFIGRFLQKLDVALVRYVRASKLHGGIGEPGFWYTEQRTKTFVTLALAQVTKGYFMQEPPVSRSGGSTSAKADYFAHTGKNGCFLEVKQAWVGANKGIQPGMALGNLKTKHEECVKQIKRITKPSYRNWSANTSIAMTLGTIHRTPGRQDSRSASVSIESMEESVADLLSVNTIHAVGIIVFSPANSGWVTWNSLKKGDMKEAYPAVLVPIYHKKFA